MSEKPSSLSPRREEGRGEGRLLKPLLLVLTLSRCSCELSAELDAGVFGCSTNDDCIHGFRCIAQRCLPEGTPPPDSGSAGGSNPFHAALRFTTPAQAVPAGACSSEVGFGFFDDAGQPTVAEADVEVTATSLDLSLFSDSACQAGQGAFPIRSSGVLYFRGARAGMFDLSLSGARLTPATQTETVTAQPSSQRLAFVSAPPLPSLAGSCVQGLTVELRDGTGAPLQAPPGGLTLELQSQPAGLRFSTDPGCAPSGPVTLPAGATRTTFAATSVSGREYVVTASAADAGSDTLAVSLRPLVRLGTCNLGDDEHVKACAVVPPLLDATRSFLVYQSTPDDHDPSRATVACVLGDAGSVTCQRVLDGGTARITWYAAELKDSRVDRYEVRCPTDGGRAVTVPLNAAVPPQRQFVLAAMSSQGVELTGNDFFTVTPSADQLDVQWGADGCGARRVQLQVVQVPGFTTSRATGSLVNVATDDGTGLPAPDGGTLALATWRAATPGGGENRVCDRMVRAFNTGGTSVRVSRAAGNTAPQCSEFDVEGWGVERVDVGQRGAVQAMTVSLGAGMATATRTISAVDPTRTLLLASGQSGGGGQAAGEGAFAVDGGGFLGEATVTLKLNSATEVQLERAGTRAAATFTVYVLQLEP